MFLMYVYNIQCNGSGLLWFIINKTTPLALRISLNVETQLSDFKN